jgi:hypothetical protein
MESLNQIRTIPGKDTMIFRFAVYSIVFLLSIGRTSPANPALEAMNDNTWLKLTPNPSQRYIPRNYSNIPGDTLENVSVPVGRAYSGIVCGQGLVYYWGGGHGSHPGNDMEIYDIENNIWIQQYKPEVCDLADESCNNLYGGAGCGCPPTPRGRPYVEHGWSLESYDPVSRRQVALYSSGFWAYDASDKSWTALIGNSNAFWSNQRAHLMRYDPDVDGFPMVKSVYGVEVGLFKRDGAYTKRSSTPPNTGWIFRWSTYAPDHHVHIVLEMEKQAWSKYDAVNDTWSPLANVPSGVQITDFDYDTRNNVLVGIHNVPGEFAVWAYHVGRNQWTQMPVTGPAPSGRGSLTGTSKKPLFKYDSLHNVFIFLDVLRTGGGGTGGIGGVDIWAYRYDKDGTGLSSTGSLPGTIRILANPNPFNQMVKIRVMSDAVSVKRVNPQVMVYNINGKQVADLTHHASRITPYLFTWDVHGRSGSAMPAGIYFVQFKTGSYSVSKKIVLTK